jgi:hypothetical protein
MAERKLSAVSQQEMRSAVDALRRMFDQFCAFGAGQRQEAAGLDNARLAKFAKDSGLLDRRLTRTDVDLIFTRVKLRGQRKLDFRGFKEAVRQMAMKKELTFQELVARAAGAGGPALASGTTRVADASQTRFHDQQDTYTGAHRAGGPNTTSANVVDIGDLLDRSEYDVRGRKVDWEEGGQRGALAAKTTRVQMAGQAGMRIQSTADKQHADKIGQRHGFGGGDGGSAGGRSSLSAARRISTAEAHVTEADRRKYGDQAVRVVAERLAKQSEEARRLQHAAPPMAPFAEAPSEAGHGSGGGGAAAAAASASGSRSYTLPQLEAMLTGQFNAFCNFGMGSTSMRSRTLPQMDNSKFAKFCRELGLIGSDFSNTDADLVWSQAVPRGVRKIECPHFIEHVLPRIAQRKGLGLMVLLQQLAARGETAPSRAGTTRVVESQTRFHDDKSTFTGQYRHGGPQAKDDRITLENLMDRSDYDVRGVKVKQSQDSRDTIGLAHSQSNYQHSSVGQKGTFSQTQSNPHDVGQRSGVIMGRGAGAATAAARSTAPRPASQQRTAHDGARGYDPAKGHDMEGSRGAAGDPRTWGNNATVAGSANKKGGVYDRLSGEASYTGVYKERFAGDAHQGGRINGDTRNAASRYQGDTNTGTDERVRDISQILRR